MLAVSPDSIRLCGHCSAPFKASENAGLWACRRHVGFTDPVTGGMTCCGVCPDLQTRALDEGRPPAAIPLTPSRSAMYGCVPCDHEVDPLDDGLGARVGMVAMWSPAYERIEARARIVAPARRILDRTKTWETLPEMATRMVEKVEEQWPHLLDATQGNMESLLTMVRLLALADPALYRWLDRAPDMKWARVLTGHMMGDSGPWYDTVKQFHDDLEGKLLGGGTAAAASHGLTVLLSARVGEAYTPQEREALRAAADNLAVLLPRYLGSMRFELMARALVIMPMRLRELLAVALSGALFPPGMAAEDNLPPPIMLVRRRALGIAENVARDQRALWEALRGPTGPALTQYHVVKQPPY